MNSGAYKFEKPETVEEKPTVSLYNLLDHSPKDLLIAMVAFKNEAERIYDQRQSSSNMADAYTSLCAWSLLFETAAKEVQDRDSEAWADKTAKEINEQTK
jgi:hypothetical protein